MVKTTDNFNDIWIILVENNKNVSIKFMDTYHESKEPGGMVQFCGTIFRP